MRWLDGITDSVDMSLGKLWGVDDGQGGLACCSSTLGHKESDKTERLKWADENIQLPFFVIGKILVNINELNWCSDLGPHCYFIFVFSYCRQWNHWRILLTDSVGLLFFFFFCYGISILVLAAGTRNALCSFRFTRISQHCLEHNPNSSFCCMIPCTCLVFKPTGGPESCLVHCSPAVA